jgi:hypothetical protein
MSLNFPINPLPGDTYTIGSTTYIWNGSAWVKFSETNKTITNLTATTVSVTSTNISTGPTSGALVVNGGVGIAGDLYLGGVLYSGGEAVLTTSSFGGTINAGDDISITDIGGGVVKFDNTSTLQSVTTRGPVTSNAIHITNTSNSTSTATGALIIDGGVGVGKDLFVNGTVYAADLKLNNGIVASARVTATTTATVSLDNYSLTQFRSAKYIIQIVSGSGPSAEVQVIEILMLADNNSNVFLVEYGSVTNFGLDQNQNLGEFSAGYNAGIVTLFFTPDAATNKEITLVRTAVVV